MLQMLTVGQVERDWTSMEASLKLAEAHDFLVTSVGMHPHDARFFSDENAARMRATAEHAKVVAWGECGLDYYYDSSPRDVQQAVFRRQCALALQLGKPLVVHVRDAHEDCLRILREERVERGVIHCFTGDTEAARGYLAQGFLLSLSGIVTYKKTEALQDAVRFAPLERLLVETDSPYLAPQPVRGRRNEPAFVTHTVQALAAARGEEPGELADRIEANAAAAFRLP